LKMILVPDSNLLEPSADGAAYHSMAETGMLQENADITPYG